jgi:hypothetical protein
MPGGTNLLNCDLARTLEQADCSAQAGPMTSLAPSAAKYDNSAGTNLKDWHSSSKTASLKRPTCCGKSEWRSRYFLGTATHFLTLAVIGWRANEGSSIVKCII